MKKKDCDGCLVNKNNRLGHDGCKWLNTEIACPCSKCLIKVMCSNTCDLFYKHNIRIHKYNNLKEND